MQIKDLPSTSTAQSTDYLVKETAAGVTNKIALGDFVIDNLTSTATDKPLSAAQGKALNDLVAQSTAKEVTAGLTAAANVTINNQHKVVSGPIRVYAIIFTASANIARDTALISGFDTQRLAVNGSTNFIMFNNNTHAEHTCFLGADGTLRCNDTINANETLRGTLVYIAT